jgi:hypothetical protein
MLASSSSRSTKLTVKSSLFKNSQFLFVFVIERKRECAASLTDGNDNHKIYFSSCKLGTYCNPSIFWMLFKAKFKYSKSFK